MFDLEIEIWIWFAKTNQVVAKDDPYMSKLNQNNFEYLFDSDFVLVLLALCCVGINHQKGGDWKGNVPWAISKYFGDWVPTQVLKCEFMPMDGQSANQE